VVVRCAYHAGEAKNRACCPGWKASTL